MRKNFGAKPMLYPMPVLVIGSFDENGVPIESAPHPMMKIKIPFSRPVKSGSLLRMKA